MARITEYKRGDFVTIEVLFEKRLLHTTTYIATDPANPKVTISHATRSYTPVNAEDLTGDSGTGYYSYKWQTDIDDPLGVYKSVVTGRTRTTRWCKVDGSLSWWLDSRHGRCYM